MHFWTDQIVLMKEQINKQTIHKAGLNLKCCENFKFCFRKKMWRTAQLGILNNHPEECRDAVLHTPIKIGNIPLFKQLVIRFLSSFCQRFYTYLINTCHT